MVAIWLLIGTCRTWSGRETSDPLLRPIGVSPLWVKALLKLVRCATAMGGGIVSESPVIRPEKQTECDGTYS